MSDGTIRIRPGHGADAEQIGLVHVRSWQSAYQGHFPEDFLEGLDPAQRAEGWRRYFVEGSKTTQVMLVAELDEQLVGFIEVGASRDDDGEGLGEVRALYVLPRFWGSGVGRSLMAGGVDALRAFGFSEATLWVLDANERARRFYEAGGWTPDGATKVDERWAFSIDEVRYRRSLS